MSMHAEQDLSDFLAYLKWEKRYSDLTVRAYHDDIASFGVFLIKEFEEQQVRNASSAMIRSWLSSLKDGKQPLSAVTIARKLSSLRSFYRYLLKKGILKASPAAQLAAPKAPKRLPVYLEEKQLGNGGAGDGWKGWNTKLIMAILYQTGMRLSELVNLRHDQINTYQQSFKVLGKGGKERFIPVQPGLMELINEYDQLKRKEWGAFDSRSTLLVTEKGKPVYAKYIYRLVQGYLQDLTSLQKKSPHVLRHSFATHLLNEGADLNAVKELLGHASLAATQVYTHNTIGKLKEVHKKAHPKG